MDPYEATRIVFSRIQSLDPENASKIMGLLLIQDHGEKEMIRLAFGPETLVHSVVVLARKELALNSPTNSSSSPSSPSLLSNSPFSRQSSASSRLGFKVPPLTIPSPTSYWNPLSDLPKADDLISPSGSSLNPSSVPFYANGTSGSDLLDEIPLFYPNHPDASDAETSAFGWRPCLYFARGFCKNGSSCKFVHGGNGEQDVKVEMMDSSHELLRSKSAHQQRLSHLLSPTSSLPYSHKRLKFLLQNDSPRTVPSSPVLAMEEFHKFNRLRSDLMSPASRQIYLTFPADSTFREEDVSNYFSIYGPVQDVRIPYQPKRMFGFVTFVYAETVKTILAKGNPHFVCDARVLVKPYKEKGKVPEKYRKQPLEREFNGPDPFDLHLGNRMFYNAQDVLWRRKLEEQVDIQQALELQSRRLMSLQLLDLKKRTASAGSPIPSPVTHPSEFPPLHATVKPPEKQSEQESLEHNLPDSPFASPTKDSDFFCAFSECDNEAADVASFPSFNCQMPRFSSGHPVVGGPTCPVGI